MGLGVVGVHAGAHTNYDHNRMSGNHMKIGPLTFTTTAKNTRSNRNIASAVANRLAAAGANGFAAEVRPAPMFGAPPGFNTAAASKRMANRMSKSGASHLAASLFDTKTVGPVYTYLRGPNANYNTNNNISSLISGAAKKRSRRATRQAKNRK